MSFAFRLHIIRGQRVVWSSEEPVSSLGLIFDDTFSLIIDISIYARISLGITVRFGSAWVWSARRFDFAMRSV